ncbi:MAG: hypothetical protein IT203_11305 [Fimbriimonadaceae bacterium]|nr:hypothetical protein [Fimbriimonadaceae bacterium]
MKRLSILAITASLVLGAFALSGCSGGDDGVSNADEMAKINKGLPPNDPNPPKPPERPGGDPMSRK